MKSISGFVPRKSVESQSVSNFPKIIKLEDDEEEKEEVKCIDHDEIDLVEQEQKQFTKAIDFIRLLVLKMKQ